MNVRIVLQARCIWGSSGPQGQLVTTTSLMLDKRGLKQKMLGLQIGCLEDEHIFWSCTCSFWPVFWLFQSALLLPVTRGRSDRAERSFKFP